MKLTFPHLGDTCRYLQIFFHEVGIPVAVPEKNSLKQLALGAAVSPEEMCLPFKLMAANLISGCRAGADTVVMAASMGPCRLGEYGELLKEVLEKEGFRPEWILLDSAKAIGLPELWRRLRRLMSENKVRRGQLLAALRNLYRLVKSFEELEAGARLLCGYEAEKGACKELLRNCRNRLDRVYSLGEALTVVAFYRELLKEVKLAKGRNPLYIALTGEIYSLIEPFATHNIEERLMDLGVCFEKRITVGWWLRNNIINPFGMKVSEKRKNPDMPHCIGGYAKETIRDGHRSRKKGWDGVIQVLPAGCMPEIVAKSVFDRMSREGELSVLTLIFDEMGGEAGYITRMEAFLDMLERRREQNRRKSRRRKKTERE